MVNIWQIYFDKESRSNCFKDWNLYNNEDKLTEFFENSVIVDLINKGEHLKGNYFGVFSHDIKKDLVFKEGNKVFNPSNLKDVVHENSNIDVFAFQKKRSNPNIIFQAEQYHSGFIKIVETILKETNYLPSIPKKLPQIVLFNYFIARSNIYEQYVKELLIPAMEVLKTIPESYNNAKYKRVDQKTAQRFTQAFGKPYYTYHAFICERLMSLFLYKNDYSFKQIF